MDYRPVFLIAAVVFAAIVAYLILRSGSTKPREHRLDNKQETAWIQVDVRYAVVALVFIAFDMEMIYMFPWAVAFRDVGAVAFWDMLVFAVILGVGLLYAGKRGAFRI